MTTSSIFRVNWQFIVGNAPINDDWLKISYLIIYWHAVNSCGSSELHSLHTQTKWAQINRRTVAHCVADESVSSHCEACDWLLSECCWGAELISQGLAEWTSWSVETLTVWPGLALVCFCSQTYYNDSSLSRLLDSHISHSAAVLSHLTCDSPNLAFEKSPNETGHMRPEADPDEVEVVEFAPFFLKTVFVDIIHKI